MTMHPHFLFCAKVCVVVAPLTTIMHCSKLSNSYLTEI